MPAHYAYRHRVTFDETNLVGNVYFAHYLRWQGHCRESFLSEHAPTVLAALSGDLALVTVDCAAEFYAETYAADLIEVRMTLDRLAGSRVSMSFDYLRLDDGRAELVARGRQSIACMRRGDGRLEPVPVPDELRHALHRFQPAERVPR